MIPTIFTRAQRPSRRARGFTLTEIMVAMVIALVGVIVIFQVFAVSEGTKRTTVSGGDAQQAGALALFTVERDLRQAGYGVNLPVDLGCAVYINDSSRTPPNFQIPFVPVQIISNPANTPDTIIVFYGNSALMTHPPKIVANQVTSNAEVISVENRYGFLAGDRLVLADAGPKCMFAQISMLPITPTSDIQHNPGSYTDISTGASVATRYNPSGGIAGAGTFTTSGRVYNLGQSPVRNQYTVTNNQLNVIAIDNFGTPPAIADNIVQFKAQYGKDTNNDGIVDTWDTVTPAIGSPLGPGADTAAWKQIIAIRLALVARSTLPAKPSC